MVDKNSEKTSSIRSPFSTMLLEAWTKWDVRGMVLFSLTLQILLSVLGWRRKYAHNILSKTILWFAYLSADWVAIATLGKLSNSSTESPTTNVIRAYWAPLLLLHLGGPDTITAYSFEDNKLWIRHLLILVVKAILVIYIICLSWTFSWLSLLCLPLILAGIIKYVERILCLKLNNSENTRPVLSNIFNPQGSLQPNQSLAPDRFPEENSNVLYGYLLFTIMRPDVNDYLSSPNLADLRVRIETYLKQTTGVDGHHRLIFWANYIDEMPGQNAFKAIAVELELMFDVIYTKAALIYSKLGCFLRLTSFTSSFFVLLLFFIVIINEPKFHFSRVDIAITGILLSGATALELYAIQVMLSSDWAILVAKFHHNMLVRKLFKVALNCFSPILRQSNRWSDRMGQFDLLEYCWRHRKAYQSCGILPKIINGSGIAEMWHKSQFTTLVTVPSYLKRENIYRGHFESYFSEKIFRKSRGEKSLQKWEQFDALKWSIELDFDHSIVVWHLATSICYYLEDDDSNEEMEDKKLSKQVSHYMMYLLVRCPALILPEHNKRFWLDQAYDNLKKHFYPTIDLRDAASTLVHEEELESSEIAWKCLQKDVFKLATNLKQLDNKWTLIRDVWIEMLSYAAISSQHISHVKQLGEGTKQQGEGIEFLSLIWLLMGTHLFVAKVFEEEIE